MSVTRMRRDGSSEAQKRQRGTEARSWRHGRRGGLKTCRWNRQGESRAKMMDAKRKEEGWKRQEKGPYIFEVCLVTLNLLVPA